MFCAVDQPEQRRIISLDPEWRNADRLDLLRNWCRADRLVCPACLATVLFRNSEIISPHFAHKTLKDCPYANENAEKLLGRQVLYEWLITKTSPANVDLEVRIQDVEMPLDVMMRHDKGQFAYYYFHRNLRKIDQQYAFGNDLRTLNASGIRSSVIYSSGLYKSVEGKDDRVRLPTLLREVMTRSDYGLPFGSTASLHFLRTKERELFTLRGVDRYEWPQTYQFGKALRSPMSSVQVTPATGEPVHPGEFEQLRLWKKEQAERQHQPQKWQANDVGLKRSLSYTFSPASAQADGWAEYVSQKRTATCGKCGNLTDEKDWIIYNGVTKTCTCRQCIHKPK